MASAKAKPPATVDDYIRAQPSAAQKVLRRFRQVCRDAAPDADECISYRIPALRQGGIVVYYAAFKSHVGLYPPVRGDEALEAAVARYAGEKGNLRFPLDEPMPYPLITRVVKHHLARVTGQRRARR